MKKFLKDGHYISRADRLAVANDLLDTLEEWALKGPKHMVTYKPVRQLFKSDLKLLKEKKQKEGKNLSADEAICVREMCALTEFKPKKIAEANLAKPKRKQARDEKILSNGIEVEDYEYTAATNYWEDAEGLIVNLIENKIARCKARFVKHWTRILMADPSITEIPTDDDDLIEMVVIRADYKNRQQQDDEFEVGG